MRHGPAARGIHLHKKGNGASTSRVHAHRDGLLRRLPDVIPGLSLQRRQRPLQRPGMGPFAVLLDPDPARNPGRSDRTARDHDDRVRAEGQLPPPQANRAMDLAALDLRLSNRRDRVRNVLPNVHANLFNADNGNRAIHRALRLWLSALPLSL